MEEANQEEINNIIANNLSNLRKKSGLTQLQLAEEMNYSDKAISKWEKGDCVPNIYVLLTLAKFYGVDIKDIVCDNPKIEPKKDKKNIKVIWSFLSAAIVFLIATISFVIMLYAVKSLRPWLCFVLAVPVSALVDGILFLIWRWRVRAGISLSIFIWSSIIVTSLILQSYEIWLIYLIGIPLQVITILIFILDYLKHRVKK